MVQSTVNLYIAIVVPLIPLEVISMMYLGPIQKPLLEYIAVCTKLYTMSDQVSAYIGTQYTEQKYVETQCVISNHVSGPTFAIDDMFNVCLALRMDESVI